MKRNLRVLFLFLTLPLFTAAQQKSLAIDIPDAVSAKFNSLYPDKKEEIWKRDRGLNYEVSFKSHGISTIVLFDEFGNVIQLETIVPVSNFFKNSIQYININYPGYKIERVVKNESGVEVFYFVQVSKEVANSLRIVFDKNGNYIRTLYE